LCKRCEIFVTAIGKLQIFKSGISLSKSGNYRANHVSLFIIIARKYLPKIRPKILLWHLGSIGTKPKSVFGAAQNASEKLLQNIFFYLSID